MTSPVQNYATPPGHVAAVARDSFNNCMPRLDACAEPWSAKAEDFYALPDDDGLSAPWLDWTWCNPPYENQGAWLARAAWWGSQGVHSACLVLASTSANYWWPTCVENGTVDFYQGRIAFIHPDTRMPRGGFDRASMLVLFGPSFTAGVFRRRCAKTGALLIGDARAHDSVVAPVLQLIPGFKEAA